MDSLKSVYFVSTYDLRICIEEDNLIRKYFNGDNFKNSLAGRESSI